MVVESAPAYQLGPLRLGNSADLALEILNSQESEIPFLAPPLSPAKTKGDLAPLRDRHCRQGEAQCILSAGNLEATCGLGFELSMVGQDAFDNLTVCNNSANSSECHLENVWWGSPRSLLMALLAVGINHAIKSYCKANTIEARSILIHDKENDISKAIMLIIKYYLIIERV